MNIDDIFPEGPRQTFHGSPTVFPDVNEQICETCQVSWYPTERYFHEFGGDWCFECKAPGKRRWENVKPKTWTGIESPNPTPEISPPTY